MHRTVIYKRISTKQQSFDMQNICTKYAKEKGFEVVNEIEEIGSGYYCNQPKLMVIIDDIKNCRIKPPINIILVYYYDRISRNVEFFCKILKTLNDCNVHIVSVEGYVGEHKSPFGYAQVLKRIVDAEMESRKISQRLKTSIEIRKISRKFFSGVVPFGYKLEDGAIKINDYEQNIIKLIFLLKTKKIKGYTIIEKLNSLCSESGRMILDETNELIVQPNETYSLSNKHVAILLNANNITKRNRDWTENSVGQTCRASDAHIASSLGKRFRSVKVDSSVGVSVGNDKVVIKKQRCA